MTIGAMIDECRRIRADTHTRPSTLAQSCDPVTGEPLLHRLERELWLAEHATRPAGPPAILGLIRWQGGLTTELRP